MTNDLIATMPRYDMTHEFLMVVGLNPSTADETKDDPTLKRCKDFAMRWGFGALCMTNLFAFRATRPLDMIRADDPVGPDNDITLIRIARDAGLVLAAWGKEGTLKNRGTIVRALVGKEMMCLRRNKDGTPQHPLYVSADTSPILYE